MSRQNVREWACAHPTGRIGAVLVVAVFAAQAAGGGSLQTSFTTVTIRNVPIGSWTRLQLPDGARYSVENTSAQALLVRLKAVPPFAEPGRRRWEPIPDPGWVRIRPEVIEVGAGEKGEADVQVHVPADAGYANRQYEVWLLARAEGGQVGVGLVTRIRFNTVEKKDADQPYASNAEPLPQSKSTGTEADETVEDQPKPEE